MLILTSDYSRIGISSQIKMLIYWKYKKSKYNLLYFSTISKIIGLKVNKIIGLKVNKIIA